MQILSSGQLGTAMPLFFATAVRDPCRSRGAVTPAARGRRCCLRAPGGDEVRPRRAVRSSATSRTAAISAPVARIVRGHGAGRSLLLTITNTVPNEIAMSDPITRPSGRQAVESPT